jgi:hypothetical protein
VLQPGAGYVQHTYAGHVWLIADVAGNVIAVYTAQTISGIAIIDGREAPPQNTLPPPVTSPNGHWGIVLRGDDLFRMI